MVNETITTIVMVYFAMIVVFFIHEVGHMGTIKIRRWFPFPKMAAMRAKYRYGGLIANAALFLGVYYWRPEELFLQLVGLVSWLHFSLYTIIGSFNYEPKVPNWMEQYWVYDDIPNKLWHVFVPLGLAAIFLLKDYYLPILVGLI